MIRAARLVMLALIPAVLVGCAALSNNDDLEQRLYQLLPPETERAEAPGLEADLVVSRMTTRPGYEGTEMAYREADFELKYFSRSRWTERPQRMLQPAVITSLQSIGPFRHVVAGQSGLPADYRLDMELIKLEQDFRTRPSRVHLVVDFQLTRERNREIILSDTLSITQAAPSDDPHGGVIAANAALTTLVENLSAALKTALAEN